MKPRRASARRASTSRRPSAAARGSRRPSAAAKVRAAGAPAGALRLPPSYPLCLGCFRHVKPAERRCPFCGADVARLAHEDLKQLQKLEELTRELERVLGPLAKA